MKLFITSVLPIEFITLDSRQELEALIKNHNSFSICTDNQAAMFLELGSKSSSVYEFNNQKFSNSYIFFTDTSACIILRRSIENFILNEDTIHNLLIEKNNLHEDLITDFEKNIGWDLENFIIIHDDNYRASPNYVFTFYVFSLQDEPNDDEKKLLKVLAEPSLIDSDDMLSTKIDNDSCFSIQDIGKKYFDLINDCDVSSYTLSYVTWPTVVSASLDKEAEKTLYLITALEVRLQTIWNRCNVVSEYIDSVFQGVYKPKDISKIYWGFTLTLDEAKSVISSTFSTRASKIFDEMVSTSKISGEIDRLEKKVNLLENFIEQRNFKRSLIYQKTIELLLFITAIASIVQILYKVPINLGNTNILSGTIITLIAIIGFWAIILKNR